MKLTLLTFLALTLFTSCKKHDYHPAKPTEARVLVQEEIAAINIYNDHKPKDRYNTIDSLVTDSVFHLYKDASGNYYDHGLRLFFKAKVDTNYHTESSWKIGDDPKVHTGNEIFVDFTYPVGLINVRLITAYRTKTDFTLVKTDTVFKKITVNDEQILFGEYEGVNTDEPTKKFKIKIGLMQESDPRVGGKIFIGIENLPEGFPIKTEIDPASRGFGVTGETIIQGYYIYRGQTVGSPYAIGFLNATGDTIRIKYNYGIIKDISNTYDWSSIITKEFLGKKL